MTENNSEYSDVMERLNSILRLSKFYKALFLIDTIHWIRKSERRDGGSNQNIENAKSLLVSLYWHKVLD